MNSKLDYVLNTFNWCLTIIQTNEVLRLIQFILCIISTILSLVFSIIKWYNISNQDGKIDGKEVNNLIDNVKDTIDDINEKIDDYNKKDDAKDE